jgi:hypothetical protein
MPVRRPRPGDAQEPGHRGRGRGQAREAGQPGAAPGVHQHGETAGVTAAHPGQAGDEPAGGRGEQSGELPRGRDGCDAGFAAERGDGNGRPRSGRKSPGREGRRCPGPSRRLRSDEAGRAAAVTVIPHDSARTVCIPSAGAASAPSAIPSRFPRAASGQGRAYEDEEDCAHGHGCTRLAPSSRVRRPPAARAAAPAVRAAHAMSASGENWIWLI